MTGSTMSNPASVTRRTTEGSKREANQAAADSPRDGQAEAAMASSNESRKKKVVRFREGAALVRTQVLPDPEFNTSDESDLSEDELTRRRARRNVRLSVRRGNWLMLSRSRRLGQQRRAKHLTVAECLERNRRRRWRKEPRILDIEVDELFPEEDVRRLRLSNCLIAFRIGLVYLLLFLLSLHLQPGESSACTCMEEGVSACLLEILLRL